MAFIKKVIISGFLMAGLFIAGLWFLNSSYKFSKTNFVVADSSSRQLNLDTYNSGTRKLDSNAMKYLENHKVYVSLTTTPDRISTVHKTLRTLDLRFVDNIILSIPERFGLTGEEYIIPSELKDEFPNLKIVTIEKDLGPITKLLPAAEYAKQQDPESIVITIDDDRLYPFAMVSELIHYSLKANGVAAGVGYKIGMKKYATHLLNGQEYPWKDNISNSFVEFVDSDVFYKSPGMLKRHFIAGYGGVAYPVKHLNIDTLKQYAALSKQCYRSDDLVVSYFLNEQKVPIVRVGNNYFNRNGIHELANAFDSTALRNDDHEVNYKTCAEHISKHISTGNSKS